MKIKTRYIVAADGGDTVKNSGFLTALLLSAVVVPAAAQAKEQFPYWYVGLSGAVVDQQRSDWGNGTKVDYDTGGSISGSLGYRLPVAPNVRIEIEGLGMWNDISKISGVTASGSVDIGAGMLNAYYDLRMAGSRWLPYIGFGAGIAKVTYDDTYATSRYVPAYQAKIGVAYRPEIFYDVVELTFGYRFFGTSDADIRGSKLSIMNHSLEAGARFDF